MRPTNVALFGHANEIRRTVGACQFALARVRVRARTREHIDAGTIEAGAGVTD